MQMRNSAAKYCFRWILIIGCVVGIAVAFHNYQQPTGRIVYLKDIYTQFEGIYVMDPDGNNVVRVPSIGLSHYTSPVWSPDGKWLAFGCHTAEGDKGNLCITTPTGWTPEGIWLGGFDCYEYKGVIDLEQTPTQFCTSDIKAVSWAPDGEQLAIACGYADRTGGLICTLKSDGSNIQCWPLLDVFGSAMLPGQGTPFFVDWSPVQDRLAVSFDRDKIYLVDPDSKNPSFLAEGTNARWTPDGERLVFYHPESGIVSVGQNGKDLRVLYGWKIADEFVGTWEAAPVFFDGTYSWSSNGRYLTFAAGQTLSGSPNAIYVLDTKQKTIEQVTIAFDGRFSAPDWSPSGHKGGEPVARESILDHFNK